MPCTSKSPPKRFAISFRGNLYCQTGRICARKSFSKSVLPSKAHFRFSFLVFENLYFQAMIMCATKSFCFDVFFVRNLYSQAMLICTRRFFNCVEEIRVSKQGFFAPAKLVVAGGSASRHQQSCGTRRVWARVVPPENHSGPNAPWCI